MTMESRSGPFGSIIELHLVSFSLFNAQELARLRGIDPISLTFLTSLQYTVHDYLVSYILAFNVYSDFRAYESQLILTSHLFDNNLSLSTLWL